MASTAPISPRSMPRKVTSRTSSARGIFKATRVVLTRSMTEGALIVRLPRVRETAADGGVEVERATNDAVAGADQDRRLVAQAAAARS